MLIIILEVKLEDKLNAASVVCNLVMVDNIC